MTTIIHILPTESKERDKVMTLTTFLIGLAISCIGGILGTIFFPETEEEKKKRKEKKSLWRYMWYGGTGENP